MTRGSTALTLAFSGTAHAFSHLFVLLFATVVLVLEAEWGITYAELQWLSVPGFVLFGFGAPICGWLGDRWSTTGMMALFFVGIGCASILTGFADSPTAILVGLTTVGAFAAIYHPVGIPWLVKNSREPARALGINGVFGSLGTAFAALVAASLAQEFGWRAAFFVPGGVAILIGLAFVWAVGSKRLVDSETDLKPQPAPLAADMVRAFSGLALAVLCTGLVFQSTSVGLPKIFDERFGEDAVGGLVAVGGFVTLAYAVSAIAQIVGGELAGRYSLKWVYLFCQFSQVPVVLVAFLLHSPILVVMATFMISLNVMSQPAENMLIARYTPLKWRGSVFGAKFLLTAGVSAAGVALVPIIHSWTGSLDALFWWLAGFAAIGGLACWILPKERADTAEAPVLA